MISFLRRVLVEVRSGLLALRRLGVRLFLALTALQAVILGVLVALAEFRKRRRGPREGFPWEEQPEIELESGEDRLKIYAYGVRLYEEMLEEIEAAEREIFVGTFIWKGDHVGRCFVEALARKAEAGVEVYVVFDGLANVFVSPSFKRFPERIHRLHFRPLSGPAKILNPRNAFRFHRHVMSVDGKVAFLGGYNIGSLYAAGWRDTHVRVRGEAAREVDNAFVDFWNAHRTGDLPRIVPNKKRDWNPAVRVRRNDPYMRIFPIREMYLEALDRANHHVLLTHAYFVPDRALKAHLIDARERGVDVQLLVPEQSNRRHRGLARAASLSRSPSGRHQDLPVQAHHDPLQDRHRRRRVVHYRQREHRPPQHARQLRAQPRGLQPQPRRPDGEDVRDGQDQRPRVDPGRMGTPPAPRQTRRAGSRQSQPVGLKKGDRHQATGIRSWCRVSVRVRQTFSIFRTYDTEPV